MSDTLAPHNPFLDEAAPTLVAEEVFHPEIHPQTLGNQQVYDVNQIAQYAIGLDPEPNGAGAHREISLWQDSLHVDLKEVRTLIRTIPESKRADCGVAVYESLPKFQQEAVQEWLGDDKSDPSRVLDWLVERPAGDLRGKDQGLDEEFPLRKADYDQRLINFLQSHNEYIKNRQQDPEFLQEVAIEKETWLLGVEYGVQSGWLHPSALERAKDLDLIKVYEGDIFSTYLNDRAGYHIFGSQDVVVGKGETHAIVHELNHALLDGARDGSEESLAADKVEGSRIMSEEERELMEAMTEHGALVFRTELKDVEYDDSSVGVYNKERERHLYSPVRRARNVGVDLTIADFMRYNSAVGKDRVTYKQDIDEKITEIQRIEDKYLG